MDDELRSVMIDDDDELLVPGEEDVVSNFDFSENVLVACPVCGSQMKARLLDKGSNGAIGDMQVTLFVTGRQCECPEVYLRYDK